MGSVFSICLCYLIHFPCKKVGQIIKRVGLYEFNSSISLSCNSFCSVFNGFNVKVQMCHFMIRKNGNVKQKASFSFIYFVSEGSQVMLS